MPNRWVPGGVRTTGTSTSARLTFNRPDSLVDSIYIGGDSCPPTTATTFEQVPYEIIHNPMSP